MPKKPLYPFAYLNESYAMIDKSYTPMLTVNGLKMSEHKMFFSSEKAKKYLGYRPRNINNAIKDSVSWFKEYFIKWTLIGEIWFETFKSIFGST